MQGRLLSRPKQELRESGGLLGRKFGGGGGTVAPPSTLIQSRNVSGRTLNVDARSLM